MLLKKSVIDSYDGVLKSYVPYFLNLMPRRLFQTWPDGPGVCLKPAYNRGSAFISKV